MVTTMTRNDCAKFLAEHDNFCILTHTRPDGDTICSASALCVGLRQLGKTAFLLENGEVSPFLNQCVLGLTKAAPEEGDTLVSACCRNFGFWGTDCGDWFSCCSFP